MATDERLAIHGGSPAMRSPLPPMYPGGLRIGEEEEAALLAVLRSKRLFRYYGPDVGPSQVQELERTFAAHFGVKHALAVTSGTAALMCALVGLGVGPGDEVIVPAYTWIASASAVIAVGAVPVIAAVDASLTLDPASVEANRTSYTRAIMAVHMRGAPAAMEALQTIAAAHGLAIIEDAAQACGGSYRGKRLGTIGDVGAFSFQYNKIITSGEGGMLVTDDDAIYRRAQMYHDVVGGKRNGVPAEAIIPGVNFRMSELHGAVALAQLGKLEGILADTRRRKGLIKSGLVEVMRDKDVPFRELHDTHGDTGIALAFFLHTGEQARAVARALTAEGIPAHTLYAPDVADYHIYAHWSPILNQRTLTPGGGPWRAHPRPVTYAPDLYPESLDLLERAVQLDVSPELTDAHIGDLVAGVTKVLEALVEPGRR